MKQPAKKKVGRPKGSGKIANPKKAYGIGMRPAAWRKLDALKGGMSRGDFVASLIDSENTPALPPQVGSGESSKP